MRKPKKGIALFTASALVMGMLAVPVAYNADYSKASNATSSPSVRLVEDGEKPVINWNIGVELDGKQRTVYKVGEEFDYTTGGADITYNNAPAIEGLQFSDPNILVYDFDTSTPTAPGKTRKVSIYGGIKGAYGFVDYDITVIENPDPVIAKIDGTQTINYMVGDKLDTSKGNFILTTQATGATETIPLNDPRVKLSSLTNDIKVQQVDATIDYNGTTINTYFSVVVKTDKEYILSVGPNPREKELKTKYELGEAFNYANGMLTATYVANTNASQKYAFNDPAITISGYDANKQGKQTITVTLTLKNTETGEVTTDFVTYEVQVGDELPEVTVTDVKVSDDAKRTYELGDTLDLTTGSVKVTYSDNTQKDFALNSPYITVTGYEANTEGTQTLTVDYKEGDLTGSTTYDVEVEEPDEIIIMDVSEDAKLDYHVGEALDLSVGELIVEYRSQKQERIALNDSRVRVTGYNPDYIGEQELTVYYENESTDYVVTVWPTTKSIALDGNQKTDYDFGEALNLDAGQVVVTLSDNTTKNINLSDASVKVTGYDANKAGEQVLTVTYDGFTATYNVFVTAELTGIKLDGTQKTEYNVGDSVDRSVGNIIASYSDGSEKTIPFSSDDLAFSNWVNTAAGQVTAVIFYEDQKVDYVVNFTQSEVTVKDMTLDGKQKTDYTVGDSIDLSTGSLNVTYSNNTTEVVPLNSSDVSVTGFDSKTDGEVTLTIIYKGFSIELDVMIAERDVVIEDVKLDGKQQKFQTLGQDLDLSTGALIVTYSDGSIETVELDDDDIVITGYDKNTLGEQALLITYHGIPIPFSVTVVNDELVVENIMMKGDQKTQYNIGDTLDRSTGTLIVMYTNGTRADIPFNDANITVTGFNSTAAAEDQEVTVSYEGKTATYTIDIVEAEEVILTGIELNNPTTSYLVGQDIDRSVGTVTLKYSDDTTKEIPFSDGNIAITGYDKTVAGEQVVTVSYDNIRTTYRVTVVASQATVTGIEMDGNQKAEYDLNSTFDFNEGKIKVTYDNGTSEEIALNADGVEVSALDTTTAGTKTVTVSYKGQTTSFTVNVKEATLTSIKVNGEQKKIYELNEDFDATQGKIIATYSDGSEKELALNAEGVEVSALDTSVAGDKTITVAYGGQTTTFTVTVNEAPVVPVYSIRMDGSQKTEYQLNDYLDLTQGKLIVTYSDGTEKEMALNDAGVSVSRLDSTTAGEKEITVSYDGKSTTFTVTVKAADVKTVTGIKLNGEQKTEYKTSDRIDLTAGKIIVSYSDNTTEEIALSDPNVTISGFNTATTGTKTVTVTYKTYSDTFDIVVTQAPTERQLVSISLKGDQKSKYSIGEELDLSVGTVILNYSDNTTEELPLNSSDVKVSALDTSSAGAKSVIVTYKNFTTSYPVIVVDDAVTVTELQMNGDHKKTYNLGDSLDLTVGTFKAFYSNGDIETIALNASGVTVTGFDNTKYGTQVITVQYKGAKSSFIITVNNPTEVTLVNIKMDGKQQTTYAIGDSLNTKDGSLILEYSDGTSSTLALDAAGVSVQGFSSTTAGSKTVVVTYEGKTTQFAVTVKDSNVVLTSISMDGRQKTAYTVGESFNANMGNVVLNYSDGNKSLLPLSSSGVTVTGFSSTSVGTRVIKVTYNGQETSYIISVNANAASNIYNIIPTGIKYIYSVGEEMPIRTGGLWVYSQRTSVFGKFINSKTYVPLNNPEVIITGFDSSTAGFQEVTFTYRGVSKTERFVIM